VTAIQDIIICGQEIKKKKKSKYPPNTPTFFLTLVANLKMDLITVGRSDTKSYKEEPYMCVLRRN
jgi:hypothetical protein